MNEKLKVRLAEIEIWGRLADVLESMRSDEADELESRRESLSDEPARWELDAITNCERKLKAIDTVCTSILKQIG